jgi:hypothetical protein
MISVVRVVLFAPGVPPRRGSACAAAVSPGSCALKKTGKLGVVDALMNRTQVTIVHGAAVLQKTQTICRPGK